MTPTHLKKLISVNLMALLTMVAGCGNSDAEYVAAPVPSIFTSASLTVKGGRGAMKVIYPGGREFVAEGRIDGEVMSKNFEMIKDNEGSAFIKYTFVYRPESDAWACAECALGLSQGTAMTTASGILWRKATKAP